MTTHRKVRVLLADDHVMVREGLKHLVNEQPDMEIVADAGEGREALSRARLDGPDVALVDVSMPGWDGVTVARELTRTCPNVRIVAVTRHDDADFVRKMFEAGAVGYVLKQSPSIELLRAIRTVAAGAQYIDPAVRTLHIPASPTCGEPAIARPGEPLTANEETVLRLIASSWTNQRIAEHLGTDVAEVADLRSTAMQKTGLLTRIQIINYARTRGWLNADRTGQSSIARPVEQASTDDH